jgi:hypothetical protein
MKTRNFTVICVAAAQVILGVQANASIDLAPGGTFGTPVAGASFQVSDLSSVSVPDLSSVSSRDLGGSAFGALPEIATAPVPEPATIISGAMLLLPFGAGAVRSLRKKIAA